MSNITFSIFPSQNFVDLSLYQFGREQCNPSHSYGPAARNRYLFHYILSGTGTLMADDAKGHTQTYQIRSGQGFMIFPEQINTYIADRNLPWEYIWVEFDGLRAKEIVEFAGLSKDHPIYKARSQEMKTVMVNELIYMNEHRGEPPFHLVGHLYLFMDAFTRSSASMRVSKSSKLQDFYIHEALAFIEQYFQNNISVEDIANTCGLNRSYFGKIFREAMGRSPQEFLMKYRMTKAAELLKLTDLSIADVGSAVGYPNQLHFSRAFKNVYGISPREWRNKNRFMPSHDSVKE
ncbi:MAG: AraC family transcriptional regulator [Clostridiales bacterium]|nr:AraC family transcriptional regulator [Clostridiales bacterium]